MEIVQTETINLTAKFNPHESQQKILNSFARFNIVIAGRRFGKSVLAVNRCIEKAIEIPGSKIWYCSPLYKQTKEIAWNLFHEYLPTELIHKKNEAELKLVLTNDSEISLKGTDNPDSLVGVGLNFVVLDEFTMMAPEVWSKIVRPMLIDTNGECLFIGTPRGFNWAYDLIRNAKEDSDFEFFQFKTIDNKAIDGIDSEVEKARKEATSELDRIIFRQEYEGTFEAVTGRPRFDVNILSNLRLKTTPPISTFNLLEIYKDVEELSVYIIGVDTSEGLITGDESSVTVINCKDYEVVGHYGGKLPPDILASYIKLWAEKFNNAFVVCESNNHGLVTLNYLKDVYKNIFARKVYDEISNEWTEKMGFQTNTRTKPFLIANLDKALRSGLKIPSDKIIDQCLTYVIEEDGKTNASEGAHDDYVISTALAVQGYIETFEHSIPKPDEKVREGTVAKILEELKNKRETKHQYGGPKFSR